MGRKPVEEGSLALCPDKSVAVGEGRIYGDELDSGTASGKVCGFQPSSSFS